jgi:hypothetical protein
MRQAGKMNSYDITYQTTTTPITIGIDADDPYTACAIVGRKTQVKDLKILKIIHYSAPDTIWNSQ